MVAVTPKIRVLVVDDHPLLRDGISALVNGRDDVELCGEASSGTEALDRQRELRPDVTLMDLQMPGMNGFDAVVAIRAEFPEARVIVLTNYQGDVPARALLKAGASGYLLKSGARTQLLDAIRRVHSGATYVQSEILKDFEQHPVSEHLSGREIAIMRMVSQGLTNKEIAKGIGVSTETVKLALKNVFFKLDATDRTQAAITATRRGFLDL
ncbi:DNA-binding NarL/FixJ family response regulator [Novosphingobium chloroacetimidivorans]|uniref:DNA-binding NarL/FixJ family response regulator n=1 Tax=Novosphingobium chloroacetimidivorans TaxID=1428314 RepID=A0A7W7KAK3_9SPHN|nr:response regulator transcription factor [Novosphingobium chloroacetimidivorans]MBB4859272.1 DNA-binding NarL/FixJ family response regulator [Novosphingobium chloroacetimidivorans]